MPCSFIRFSNIRHRKSVFPPPTPVRYGQCAIAPDLAFWIAFAVKLLLTAGIVVGASVVVERAGPLIGALVVTLPVTVWPSYVFLSLEHDVAFLLGSAQSGLAINGVSAVFMLVYLLLAQHRSLLLSVCAATACWIALAFAVHSAALDLPAAALLNLLTYAGCLWVARRYREASMPSLPRQWYELPLRTLLVCSLVGAVLLLSNVTGPIATGVLSVYPISTTCTMLILHPRIGGRAAAAVIANALWGLFGIAWGLFAFCLALEPLGKGAALALLLAVPVFWNMSIWAIGRRRLAARSVLATHSPRS